MIVWIVFFACVLVWGAFLFSGQLGPRKVDLKHPENAGAINRSTEQTNERYQKMSAEELKDLSTDVEMEAQVLENAGDHEAASLKYQQAFELQKSIYQNHPASLQSDASRLIRLKLKVQNTIAEPLFINSSNLEQQADSSAETGNFNSAIKTLTQAIAIQQELNDNYRDTRRASMIRLRQMEGKLAELKSKVAHIEIESVLERAASSKEIGDIEEAKRLFQEAASLQKQLNENFPDSTYASQKKADEFERQYQVTQSTAFVREIQEKSAQLDQLLVERKIEEAKILIEELYQSFQAFEEAFPLIEMADETLSERVKYLNQKKAALDIIQDQVCDALIELPDTRGVYMLRTEVPQSLYVLLIGTNPSRNQADLNPVDSVSWLEAEMFCERLSWILGKEVRLPTEREFRKAINDFNPPNLDNFAWGVTETKGLSQPVGQKKPSPNGYFDLLGNASEWLASEDSAKTNFACHIGGHAQDNLSTIASMPIRELRKTERNRLVGFRVVLQLD